MKLLSKILPLLIAFGISHFSLSAQNKTDVLIIGGGAGGTSAAVQAARMGVHVTLVESSDWLGGMLTSAGVSAIDGNHRLPYGIWGEFRDSLYHHYGSAKAVETGWVSNTLFEPQVGQRILKNMAVQSGVNILLKHQYREIQQLPQGWRVLLKGPAGTTTLEATVLLDATETGELLPLVGAEFRLGMDSREDTGESWAPLTSNRMVQDLTWVAVLEEDHSRSKSGLVARPKDFNPTDFECACKDPENETSAGVDCDKMLEYGKLPNGKYMINWPNCGNDYYVNWGEMSTEQRNEALQKAKNQTLSFVYYIQQVLGYKHLRLSKVFGTRDRLARIPYDREARRMAGKILLTANHLQNPYQYSLYKTGIAVGDYPIDHHHKKNPDAPHIEFIDIKIPSYSIPMGVLIPDSTPRFLVAEKNISVSNIVNGTTRLQPVVLGIGQASGALAALAVKMGLDPSEVPVREVQNALLASGAGIQPLIDVGPGSHGYKSMQKTAASGVLLSYGISYKWANQTWFYPERIVSEYEWVQGLLPIYPQLRDLPASGAPVTLDFVQEILKRAALPALTGESWQELGIQQPFQAETPLNRLTVSILSDQLLHVFDHAVDLEGKLIN